MMDLIAIQPRFEIKVNTWGMPNDTTLEDVIRRANWYGTAHVNEVVEGTVIDGKTPLVLLEFDRHLLKYQDRWSDVSVDRNIIRIIANDVNVVMAHAVKWMSTHPEYTLDQPDEAHIKAFYDEQVALEHTRWREHNV